MVYLLEGHAGVLFLGKVVGDGGDGGFEVAHEAVCFLYDLPAAVLVDDEYGLVVVADVAFLLHDVAAELESYDKGAEEVFHLLAEQLDAVVVSFGAEEGVHVVVDAEAGVAEDGGLLLDAVTDGAAPPGSGTELAVHLLCPGDAAAQLVEELGGGIEAGVVVGGVLEVEVLRELDECYDFLFQTCVVFLDVGRECVDLGYGVASDLEAVEYPVAVELFCMVDEHV